MLGQLEDRDRLAHLEHVDLAAALAQRAGPDDQLHRLRDGHEVAVHPRVGDGHRTAGGDLAAEDRDHRARRAEHVAEANGGVPGLGVLDRRRLDRPLGERLGGAHHRRRHDRLVGGHQHERADARSRRRSGPRAGWPARCCGSPRRGSAPSSRRACRRRRGRRSPGGARSSPRACAPPPCSRPAPAPRCGRGGPPRARARSRTGCPRRGRPATSWRGPTRAIWRHSSEPIEPPAPVTITTWPAR